MANETRPVLTPEQANALVVSTIKGVVLFGTVGAAGGALLSESGSRGKGALIGAGIAIATPLALGFLIGLSLRGFTIGPAPSSGAS